MIPTNTLFKIQVPDIKLLSSFVLNDGLGDIIFSKIQYTYTLPVNFCCSCKKSEDVAQKDKIVLQLCSRIMLSN